MKWQRLENLLQFSPHKPPSPRPGGQTPSCSIRKDGGPSLNLNVDPHGQLWFLVVSVNILQSEHNRSGIGGDGGGDICVCLCLCVWRGAYAFHLRLG